MFDNILEVAGIACILCGQLLRVSARGHKARVSANGHSLVTDGPYSLVRNPMYLGIVLIGLGVVVFAFQIWVFAVFVVLFLLRYIHLFMIEENHLRKMFGEEYAAYLKNVPRLIPRPKFLFTRDIASYLPVKMSWFRGELFSIALVLAAILAVEGHENYAAGGWPLVIAECGLFGSIILLYYLFIWLLSTRDEDNRT